MTKPFLPGLLCLVLCGWIAACQDCDWTGTCKSSSTTASAAPTVMTMSGNAVDAPLAGATVNLYVLNADGGTGALLGSTTTDAAGDYSLSLTSVPQTPVIAVATGGSYLDEALGTAVPLAAGDALSAVLPAGTVQATVTPLTSIAAARAVALAKSGIPLDIAISSSNAGVARQFGIGDIVALVPGSASDSAAMQTAKLDERNYSLVLAGISQEATGLNVRAIDLASALAADAQDGLLDSKNAAGGIAIPKIGGGSAPLTSVMGTMGLQASINAYLASGRNKTNLAQVNIASDAVPIGVSTAAGLYSTTTTLPAWYSGKSGSATLQASGGTPPYSCALKTGSPPSGIGLATTCIVSGTAPVLAAGTTMSISPPFTVTITDAAGAHVDLELRVTILVGKPVLTLMSGTLTANQSGSTEIASATGGTPKYSFRSDSFVTGAPPIGTFVDGAGFLTGTPQSAGTFTFGVCVVDSIGAYDCGMASVTVVAGSSSPSPSTSTYNWANWSCGSSSQCAGLLGGYTGSAGPMCTVNDCNAWGQKYIRGGYQCSTSATYAKSTAKPKNGICLQSGVDF